MMLSTLTCSIDMLERREFPSLHLVNDTLHAILGQHVRFSRCDSLASPYVFEELLCAVAIANDSEDFALRGECTQRCCNTDCNRGFDQTKCQRASREWRVILLPVAPTTRTRSTAMFAMSLLI